MYDRCIDSNTCLINLLNIHQETLFYEFWFDARCLDHNYNQGQNVMNSDTVLCKAMENISGSLK